MKKTRFCPKCNLKMRKVTVKNVVNSTTPDGSSFGMYTFFKPVNLGGNVVYSQKVMMCPKCRRQIPVIKPEKNKAQKKNNGTAKKGTFWKVLLVLLILVVVLAVAAVVLYKAGHMPQSVVDFVKKIMPDRIEEFLKARLV